MKSLAQSAGKRHSVRTPAVVLVADVRYQFLKKQVIAGGNSRIVHVCFLARHLSPIRLVGQFVGIKQGVSRNHLIS